MKFGQLIEDNTKNLFLEKSCTRYVEETSARHFFFKKKMAYPWINSQQFHTVCFCYMSISRTKTY